MLAMKCASLARIAKTLVETYLGRDAGRLVLNGQIARGVTDRIQAVLWFSDLHGFTHITETADPEQIIPFLNDYAEAIISSIYEAGGDVLKLIGDGTLAIFRCEDAAESCRAALKAEQLMRSRVRALNEQRLSCNLPVTSAYLGLHIGEVFYGNIGSQDRLDFTVVGPAVNEVSRIGALCRSVERDVLVSSAFHATASARRPGVPGLRRSLRPERRRPAAGAVHARSVHLGRGSGCVGFCERHQIPLLRPCPIPPAVFRASVAFTQPSFCARPA